MPISPATKRFLECESREELALFLGIKKSKLLYYAFSKKNKYKEFKLTKKDGSDREILAPHSELKDIQRKLKVFFEEIYHPPSSAYGFIKDKDYVKNAEQHLKRQSILNFDLQNFFPSIHSGRIYGIFQSKPFQFNKEVASALTGLVTYKNALPQGAPTSPVLSNIIAYNLDRHFIQLAKKDRLMYTRYADDISFSSRSNDLPENYYKKIGSTYVLEDKVEKILRLNGFEVNPRKTRFHGKNKPHYVTGVKVNLKPNVDWRLVRQIRSMMHALEKWGLEAAQNKHNELYNKSNNSKNFLNVLRGKINYVKHIRTDLDLTYRRLYNRFVELEGKGNALLPISEVEDLFLKVQIVAARDRQGTGFILRDKYLITCAHTVGELDLNSEIEYFNYNEFPLVSHHKGRILYKHNDSDIAIISLASEHRNGCSISFLEGDNSLHFSVDDRFKAIGFPDYRAGKPPHVISLQVSSWGNNRHDLKEIYVDRPLFSGMSGGVILDENKKVVGMISRGSQNVASSGSTYGNVFIPLLYIQRLISEYEENIQIPS